MVFNHSVDLQGVDRFEKRAGVWAIAARVCISEAINELTPASLPADWRELLMSNGNSTRDSSDVSFDRPMKAREPGSLRRECSEEEESS
jgi:hypothetical protein